MDEATTLKCNAHTTLEYKKHFSTYFKNKPFSNFHFLLENVKKIMFQRKFYPFYSNKKILTTILDINRFVHFLCVKKEKSRKTALETDQFHKKEQNNIETHLISRAFSGAINLSSFAFLISFILTHKQAIYSLLRCNNPPPNKDVK